MSLTSDFILAAQDFASRYVILVQEGGDPSKHVKCTKIQPVTVGAVQQYPAANMIFTFTMERISGLNTMSWNQVYCLIADLPTGGTSHLTKCFLLPYARNETTQMRLNNAADFFFTSTLCGCTVQVDGPRNSPRVCHANAGDIYENAYNGAKDTCTLKGKQAIHDFAETRADLAAQAAMDGTLPAPGGGLVGRVTKADYLSQFTRQNLKTAKAIFQTESEYRLDSLKTATSKGGLKPSIGAFVFGRKDVRDEWTFYYQSNIEVSGHVSRGTFMKKKKELWYEAVVLGRATQFYP
ncbi:MAG: hypothetical protein J5I93_03775 [Pirellulaceae bacterium]|nr:hypothetical protein [Pirellulaceae bacterium]